MKHCTVEPQLSRLGGTELNGPDNEESRWSKLLMSLEHNWTTYRRVRIDGVTEALSPASPVLHG